jgi:ketosteroid isomerase-like protein
MSLPKAEGPGHSHSHADGEEHGDAPAAAATEAATAEAEHSHDDAPAAAHDSGGHQHDAGMLSHSAKGPAETVDAFFATLKAGDLARAKSLLDPNVRIFESGGAERSAEEYAGHHLPADSAFLKTATQEVTQRIGDAVGDLAWVASEQRIQAESKGKPVDILSTETMVLRKTADGWRIVHIHWSSRPNN